MASASLPASSGKVMVQDEVVPSLLGLAAGFLVWKWPTSACPSAEERERGVVTNEV